MRAPIVVTLLLVPVGPVFGEQAEMERFKTVAERLARWLRRNCWRPSSASRPATARPSPARTTPPSGVMSWPGSRPWAMNDFGALGAA